MIIPRYWAEAKIKTHIAGRSYTLKRFGWSDQSVAAAQRHAEQRVAEAIEKINAGEHIRRIEHKVPYNGAEGLPIREEIIAQHDDVMITRNGYGALCLNTPDVLFADIDFAESSQLTVHFAAFFMLLLLSIAVSAYFMSWMILVIGLIISFLFTRVFAKSLSTLQRRFITTPEQRSLALIRNFSQQHPHWHLRVYRTPKGYRILAMHQTFDANGKEAQLMFEAIKADPHYVRMCKNQNCFRARISPKPWRIGMNRLRLGIWPVDPQDLAIREAWVSEYEQHAKHYSSCRFVEQFGSQIVNAKAKQVQLLHDQYCKSGTHLDLA
ncbi:hypothetical protein ACNQO6_16685 [Acinetobacter calcoaceticus]|uniref:hypothetical protein n=1 Tax=Acinetobacter calcoaceticus TaxID=471 RepID=UPI002B2A7284|nr:hypothetical protein SB581_17690 [Acinetobacter baumannii]